MFNDKAFQFELDSKKMYVYKIDVDCNTTQKFRLKSNQSVETYS